MSESPRTIAFHGAMVELYRRAKVEAKYNASYFLGMLGDIGGYETAKYLIRTDKPSIGYTALYDRGRLDLTVEAVVMRSEWDDLFTDDDRLRARRRLSEHGFDVDAFLASVDG
jgi:hypothetical protein